MVSYLYVFCGLLVISVDFMHWCIAVITILGGWAVERVIYSGQLLSHFCPVVRW